MIGQWVRRGAGKWHYVESEIEDRAVTHCGRQMHDQTRNGFRLAVMQKGAPMLGLLCVGCARLTIGGTL